MDVYDCIRAITGAGYTIVIWAEPIGDESAGMVIHVPNNPQPLVYGITRPPTRADFEHAARTVADECARRKADD